MKCLYVIALAALVSVASVNAAEEGKHLFILSGQSNMANLAPNVSFTPAVEAAFGKDNVIVVKDARGSSAIRKWYKNWKPAKGDVPKDNGDLYDRLMLKVNAAIGSNKIQTVTFVWMQGEHDAHEKNDNVYKESLLGLVKQLSDDMKRDDVNYVIGRLSRFRADENWEGVRKAQVEAAAASPRGAWVDTDDVDINGIHYTTEGYKDLGKRFAEKAIALIKKEYAPQPVGEKKQDS